MWDTGPQQAIASNNVKYDSFVLAEGVLPESSARAKFFNVAQYKDNASRALLSYVYATETKTKGPERGIPLCDYHNIKTRTK